MQPDGNDITIEDGRGHREVDKTVVMPKHQWVVDAFHLMECAHFDSIFSTTVGFLHHSFRT